MSPSTSVISPPSQDVAPRKSYQDFASVFDVHNIRYVRVQWVDLNNQVRARVLSVSYFRKLLESECPGITMIRATLAFVVLRVAAGFSSVGEIVYNMYLYLVPTDPPMRYAQQELGIQFLVGVETEFTLLKSTNPIVPVNDHQWSTTLALATGTVEARVLEEIADALEADGINLEMYHSEIASGQYEIVTGPMSPLEAADALVHTRETICNIASKHGLRATLAPKLGSCGTGAHTHVSVRGDRPGTSSSELMTPVESAFLAGLMHHLPSVIAFTLPLTASYARVVDGRLSGGTWVCWGVDNREAPVRLTKPHLPSSRNFEIRPVDGTSNPYLAIAGILACGVLGVRDNLTLGVKNCDSAAAKMTDAEKAAMGITKQLPSCLAEARRCMAADDAIKALLGDEVVEHFVRMNEMLEKVMDRREGESEAQAVTRLVENY